MLTQQKLNFRLVENVQVIVKTIVSEYLEMEPIGEEAQAVSVSACIFLGSIYHEAFKPYCSKCVLQTSPFHDNVLAVC